MPVSHNNKAYYTKEQYEAAKQNSNALEYAQRQGYELVKTGRYYHMKEHDSLVFSPSGFWFWNSRGLQGRAAEFIMYYEGKSFSEAVLILAGDSVATGGGTARVIPQAIPPPAKEIAEVAFTLPKRASDERRLFGYLCGTRKLDNEVVKEMIRQKVLYESVSPNHLHNACFVSYDETGKPCSAFLRGLASSGPAFKGEVPGGNKNWGWLLHGKQPDTLHVFEAAIDAASYASILRRNGLDPFQGMDYLALGGLQFNPIENYLLIHPDIERIFLLLDQDKWGRLSASRFQSKLLDQGYEAIVSFPPTGKDWNEALQQIAVNSN